MREGSAAEIAFCERTIAEFGKTRPGYVNAEEWGAHAWRTYAGRFDANHDGKVTLEELTAHEIKIPPTIANRERIVRLEHQSWVNSFKSQDHGHKGYIDQHDVTIDYASDFRLHDLNHDGWLNAYECAITPPQLIDLI